MIAERFLLTSGLTIWASDDSQQSIDGAKKYISDEKLDGVKIVRREEQILVVVR